MKNQLSIIHFAVICALTPVLALVSGCGNGENAAEKGEAALREGKYASAAKSLEAAARKTQPTSHFYYTSARQRPSQAISTVQFALLRMPQTWTLPILTP